MSAPILVFGAPFSGTSLLAQMLGSHPQLAPMPELRLGLAERVDALLEIFAISQAPIADGLLRAIAEHLTGGQNARGIAAARDWLQQRSNQRTADVLAALAAAVAPRRLVIPDSESALRPHELLRWQALAPQADLVHCLRHPLPHGVVWSRWLASQVFVPADYRDHARSPQPAAIEPQLPWLRCQRNLQRWWPAAQRRMLRMESLQSQPDQALSALIAGLGLAPVETAVCDRMMAAADSPFAGFGPPEAPRGLEMEVLDPVLDGITLPAPPYSLAGPVPWRDDGAAFDPEVRALARSYGYEDREDTVEAGTVR